METKKFVTVTEMAGIVGLSRSRFYQLVGTAFPFPLYSTASRRPFYDEELQRVCIDVRRQNCGVDGKPVFFYCRGANTPLPKRKPKVAKPNQYADLLEGLEGLGLATTADQVENAVQCLYPNGLATASQDDVLRAVFLHLKRQNRSDNVGQ